MRGIENPLGPGAGGVVSEGSHRYGAQLGCLLPGDWLKATRAPSCLGMPPHRTYLVAHPSWRNRRHINRAEIDGLGRTVPHLGLGSAFYSDWA